MTVTVNGRECSRSSLADIYWSFGELLAYVSLGTELVTGDIIGPETCSGCIRELSLVHGDGAYPWLEAGDRVETTVEHLGTTAGRVVPGRR